LVGFVFPRQKDGFLAIPLDYLVSSAIMKCLGFTAPACLSQVRLFFATPDTRGAVKVLATTASGYDLPAAVIFQGLEQRG
jgi:hypothetical protein